MAKKIIGVLLGVIVVAGLVTGGLIWKHQTEVKAQQAKAVRVYKALQNRAQTAVKTAYTSRQASDIQAAQKLADKLHQNDKAKAKSKLAQLKSNLTAIAQAQTAVDSLAKNRTDQTIAQAQSKINLLSNSYEAKDKAALQAKLQAQKNQLAADKAAAAAKAKAAKLAAEKAAAAKQAAAKAAQTGQANQPNSNNSTAGAKSTPAGGKMIALTFDDGPNPATTPTLLATLQRYGVHATFFALGQEAQASPNLIKQEAAQGNEVASHTWDHADLTTLSSAAQTQEIMSAHNLINQLTGQNVMLYRPPYGNYNATTLAATDLTAVCWSVDTNDWRYVNNSQAVIDNALSSAHDGAIILIHDIHSWSVAAVPTIIERLKAEGYQFVTVSQLLQARDGGAQAHRVYFGQ